MKKNTLIINKTNKVKAILPVIATVGMLNCFGLSPRANTQTSQLVKAISLGYETLDYVKAENYTEQQATKTLNSMLASELNKLVIKDITNEAVQKEIQHHLKNMSENTLKLARTYKSLENHTINKSGLSVNEIYKATNDLTIKVDAQHYLHTTLDRLNLIRLGADQENLDQIFQMYRNENLAFSINPKNNVRKETNFFLQALKEDIKTFIQLSLKSDNPQQQKLIDEISTDLNEIEHIITNTEYTKANCNYLFYLINKLTDSLPAEIFGTRSMRRGLITEFATQHCMNTMLTNVIMFGYNLDDTKTQNKHVSYIKEK